MSGQVNGIKETIYQIFDIVFPADLGNVTLGINEYQELAESFRKLVDVAVEENEATVSSYMNNSFEEWASIEIDLKSQIIEKDAQLQETSRVNELLSTHHNQEIHENQQLKQQIEQLERKVTELEGSNTDLADKVYELRIHAGGLQEQIVSKDEQIAKLTEEINKPKANIVIPSQGKSVNLQQLMEAAKNKPVKSQMDLALSGQTFRGKVELAIPPSYNGGSNDDVPFYETTVETNVEDSGVFAPSIPSVEEVTPSQTETEIELGMDANTALRSDDGPATWGELKALEARIEERLQRIELQAVAV